jgi:hypothetical protein
MYIKIFDKIGEWNQGSIEGKGIYKYANGTKYEGEFSKNT